MLPEVSLFLASDASEDDKQQAADELCSRLLDGSVNLLQLVTSLEGPLTSTDDDLRHAGVSLLSKVAAGGCSRMDGAALHVLTEYLCARLRDWACVGPAAIGCIALLEGAGTRLRADSALSMLHAVHDIQGLVQYKQPERQAVLQLLLRLLRVHGAHAAAAHEPLPDTVIACIDAEKDPRCLLLSFETVQVLCGLYHAPGVHAAPLRDASAELVDVLSAYFPVTFKPQPAAPGRPTITRQDLSHALACALCGSPFLAPHVLPLIKDKLSSTYKVAKEDAMTLLLRAADAYGREALAPHLQTLWPALRNELLAPCASGIAEEDLDALTALAEQAAGCLTALTKACSSTGSAGGGLDGAAAGNDADGAEVGGVGRNELQRQELVLADLVLADTHVRELLAGVASAGSVSCSDSAAAAHADRCTLCAARLLAAVAAASPAALAQVHEAALAAAELRMHAALHLPGQTPSSSSSSPSPEQGVSQQQEGWASRPSASRSGNQAGRLAGRPGAAEGDMTVSAMEEDEEDGPSSSGHMGQSAVVAVDQALHCITLLAETLLKVAEGLAAAASDAQAKVALEISESEAVITSTGTESSTSSRGGTQLLSAWQSVYAPLIVQLVPALARIYALVRDAACSAGWAAAGSSSATASANPAACSSESAAQSVLLPLLPDEALQLLLAAVHAWRGILGLPSAWLASECVASAAAQLTCYAVWGSALEDSMDLPTYAVPCRMLCGQKMDASGAALDVLHALLASRMHVPGSAGGVKAMDTSLDAAADTQEAVHLAVLAVLLPALQGSLQGMPAAGSAAQLPLLQASEQEGASALRVALALSKASPALASRLLAGLKPGLLHTLQGLQLAATTPSGPSTAAASGLKSAHAQMDVMVTACTTQVHGMEPQTQGRGVAAGPTIALMQSLALELLPLLQPPAAAAAASTTAATAMAGAAAGNSSHAIASFAAALLQGGGGDVSGVGDSSTAGSATVADSDVQAAVCALLQGLTVCCTAEEQQGLALHACCIIANCSQLHLPHLTNHTSTPQQSPTPPVAPSSITQQAHHVISSTLPRACAVLAGVAPRVLASHSSVEVLHALIPIATHAALHRITRAYACAAAASVLNKCGDESVVDDFISDAILGQLLPAASAGGCMHALILAGWLGRGLAMRGHAALPAVLSVVVDRLTVLHARTAGNAHATTNTSTSSSSSSSGSTPMDADTDTSSGAHAAHAVGSDGAAAAAVSKGALSGSSLQAAVAVAELLEVIVSSITCTHRGAGGITLCAERARMVTRVLWQQRAFTTALQHMQHAAKAAAAAGEPHQAESAKKALLLGSAFLLKAAPLALTRQAPAVMGPLLVGCIDFVAALASGLQEQLQAQTQTQTQLQPQGQSLAAVDCGGAAGAPGSGLLVLGSCVCALEGCVKSLCAFIDDPKLAKVLESEDLVGPAVSCLCSCVRNARGAACAAVRESALHGLAAIMDAVAYHLLHPTRQVVLRTLGDALDDPRRSVRRAAVAARKVWAIK